MSSFTIRISGEVSALFSCDETDSLLQGAQRRGIGFPYECGTGACGSCKFELLEGEIENAWPAAPGLGRRDRRKGRMLGCQSRPKSDCVVSLSVAEKYVPVHRPAMRQARLDECVPLTHDISEFRFSADQPARFRPGQYALLTPPGLSAARAYSMSNLPNGDGEWHFQIKRVPGGAATSILFDRLAPGDRIGIDGPYGLAYWREDSPRELVCIAGGSGLSPMISIARAEAHSQAHGNRPIHFFYGGRKPEDICGADMIAALPGKAERVCFHAAVSDAGGEAWPGHHVMIHELAESTLARPLERYEFYIAGPPAMVEATMEMLAVRHKVPVGQIHYDSFY